MEAVEADLATTQGVDKLVAAIGSRPVDALLANAGAGWAGASSTKILLPCAASGSPASRCNACSRVSLLKQILSHSRH